MDALTPLPSRRNVHGERRSGGFTLIEVTLALTVLAIGLLALGATQLLVMDYGARGKHDTQAAEIAQTQIEQLQRRTWTHASMQPTGGWAVLAPVNVVVQDGTNVVEQSYAVSMRIADHVAGVTRSVDVRVDWDEPKRPGRRYALSSIRFNLEGL